MNSYLEEHFSPWDAPETLGTLLSLGRRTLRGKRASADRSGWFEAAASINLPKSLGGSGDVSELGAFDEPGLLELVEEIRGLVRFDNVAESAAIAEFHHLIDLHGTAAVGAALAAVPDALTDEEPSDEVGEAPDSALSEGPLGGAQTRP